VQSPSVIPDVLLKALEPVDSESECECAARMRLLLRKYEE